MIMARICISTITPINIATKDASISAVITDAEVHNTPITVSVTRAFLETAAQKLIVADEIWVKYQAKIADDAAIAEILSALENPLNLNIEAR